MGAGHVAKRPEGPLTGARREQDNPLTGAPLVVATTVTVNVSPGAMARVESVILRVKAVAVLPAACVSVTISVGVIVAAAPRGDVPLMTGPLGEVAPNSPLASVWAKVPANMPVAEQARRIIATTTMDMRERKVDVDAI